MTRNSAVRARIRVLGRVQGVAYRAYAREVAARYALAGGVRNLPDGSVEVEAEGDKPAVEALIQSLHIGPRLAKVDRVEVQWESPNGQQTEFLIWID